MIHGLEPECHALGAQPSVLGFHIMHFVWATVACDDGNGATLGMPEPRSLPMVAHA